MTPPKKSEPKSASEEREQAQRKPARKEELPPQFKSAKEVSRTLGVSRKTIYKLTKAGRLPFITVGKRRKYDINAVIAACSPHH